MNDSPQRGGPALSSGSRLVTALLAVAALGTMVAARNSPRTASSMVAVPSSDAVAAFEIDRAPVTVAHYRLCVEAGRCDATALEGQGSGACAGEMPGARAPINCIGRADASAYCGWAGKRLPSRLELDEAGAPANAGVVRDVVAVVPEPNDGGGAAALSLRCAR